MEERKQMLGKRNSIIGNIRERNNGIYRYIEREENYIGEKKYS